MRFILVSLSVLLFACSSESKKSEKIRVVGEGKIKAKPDQVTLTLNVSFTKPRMVDAVGLTQQTIDSVVNILQKYQKSESDIKTSSVSANKEYSYNSRTPLFVGFQASQSIEFVLNDINKFTELTGKLLETKINSISQVQFGHSKADSLFREADLLAYDDAHKSAKKLCDRADVELGKLLFMSNANGMNANETDGGYTAAESIQTFNKGYGGRGFRISPEVMEFRRTIVSEYAIK